MRGKVRSLRPSVGTEIAVNRTIYRMAWSNGSFLLSTALRVFGHDTCLSIFVTAVSNLEVKDITTMYGIIKTLLRLFQTVLNVAF